VVEVGALAELWRYPVKSMLGERVAGAEVSVHGLPGDRRLALVDRESGKIASAKAPRLWRDLLRCSAALDAEPAGAAAAGDGGAGRTGVRIDVPGGKPLWSTDSDVDEVLSAYVGRPVHLADSPPPDATLDRSVPDEVLRAGLDAEVEAGVVHIGAGTPAGGGFVDFAPLHLITTATLDRIAELSPRGAIELERYRPNLVIRTPGSGFVENDWQGREIRIGARLRLKVIAATPRCAVPTLEHGERPRDVAALRTLAAHNRIPAMPDLPAEPCAGVYAQILTPGRIMPGDKVLISAA
jgi:hypothetical protein